MESTIQPVKAPPSFEWKLCSRCGGCGKYSFNMRHGSVCYGCGGKGWQFTKRGAAAKDFYNKFFTVDIRDLRVGDKIWESGVTFGGDVYYRWMIVTEIVSVDPTHIRFLDGKDPVDSHGGSTFRIRPRSEAARLEAIAAALAYQETLTQTGTVRKVKKVSK